MFQVSDSIAWCEGQTLLCVRNRLGPGNHWKQTLQWLQTITFLLLLLFWRVHSLTTCTLPSSPLGDTAGLKRARCVPSRRYAHTQRASGGPRARSAGRWRPGWRGAGCWWSLPPAAAAQPGRPRQAPPEPGLRAAPDKPPGSAATGQGTKDRKWRQISKKIAPKLKWQR